jgi:hypothetical protein
MAKNRSRREFAKSCLMRVDEREKERKRENWSGSAGDVGGPPFLGASLHSRSLRRGWVG